MEFFNIKALVKVAYNLKLLEFLTFRTRVTFLWSISNQFINKYLLMYRIA